MRRSDRIQKLAQQITVNSRNHGFWDSGREPPETVCLIHSEISEALEEYRDRPTDLLVVRYREGDEKPEGFGVELADIGIRILDWVGHDGIKILPAYVGKGELIGHIPRDLAVVHSELSKALDGYLSNDNTAMVFRLSRVFWMIVRMARMHKIPLWSLISEKHKFNVGRPYKHGKAC